uniref:Uncharacterized protein LOC111114062 n=1 Tax=Crassostrea virginica TaxID=6565 RepID=A0A8B8BXN3_CRAVI|nr:uncharacterized protein LOC111114062 [Crassostrea virginica]
MHHYGGKELPLETPMFCFPEPNNRWDPKAVTIFHDREKEWQNCEGHLLKSNDLSFQTIRPCTADIDKDRLEKDVRLSFRFFRKEEDKIWWENFLGKVDIEDAYSSEEEDISEAVLQRKIVYQPEVNCPTPDLDLSDTDSPIPPVVIGKKKRSPPTDGIKYGGDDGFDGWYPNMPESGHRLVWYDLRKRTL